MVVRHIGAYADCRTSLPQYELSHYSVVPDPRVHSLIRKALMDANDDIPAVLHIWWAANSTYPELPLSERLALSEQVIRQILDDGLVVLIRRRRIDNEGEEVPPEQWDSLLKRWDTWVAPEGVTLHYKRPEGVRMIPIPPPLA